MPVRTGRVNKAYLPARVSCGRQPTGSALRSFTREKELTGSVVSPTGFGADPKRAIIRELGHDLRTPLNAVIGFSELLLSGAAGDIENERHREYLEYVRKSGKNLLDIVNDLLEEKDRDEEIRAGRETPPRCV
ncbi:MAG: histidine kinase dimerization/phospho-acceptor domain-containing protein [Alphaproteobacteria bacterium]|jgi:signal transduction histidine kinase